MKIHNHLLILILLSSSQTLLGSNNPKEYTALPSPLIDTVVYKGSKAERAALFAAACTSAFDEIWKRKKEQQDTYDHYKHIAQINPPLQSGSFDHSFY